VQGRAVGRPAQHHDRPHYQAEEADEREVVEEADVALRQRLDRHLQRATLVGAQERVGHTGPGLALGQPGLDLFAAQHLVAVDGQQHVARPHAGQRRRPALRDAPRGQALRALPPEDAVVHERPGGLEEDVVDPEGRQEKGNREDRHVLEPGPHRGNTAAVQTTCRRDREHSATKSFRINAFTASFVMPDSCSRTVDPCRWMTF
jgi:hypothetical protein